MGRFGIGRGPVGDSGLCSWHNGGDPLEAQLQYTTVLQHTGDGDSWGRFNEVSLVLITNVVERCIQIHILAQWPHSMGRIKGTIVLHGQHQCCRIWPVPFLVARLGWPDGFLPIRTGAMPWIWMGGYYNANTAYDGKMVLCGNTRLHDTLWQYKADVDGQLDCL